MSKKLGLIIVFPLIAFLLFSVFSLKTQNVSSIDFETFANEYQKMVESSTLLDGYKEKTICYDDVLEIDGKSAMEASSFCKAVGENFELKEQTTYDAGALSIGSEKKGYFLESQNGDSYEIEKPILVNNETYFQIDSVAKALGYELEYGDEEIVVQKTFETKRLVVTANGAVENFGATAVLENYLNLHIFEYETEQKTMIAYNKLKNLKNVLNVEVDSVAKIEEESAQILGLGDSFSYTSWGADAMHVETYSNFLLTKQEIRALNTVYVAVLDTGIDTDHSWFEGRVALNLGKNFSSSTSSTSYEFEDGHRHGTHVSGIIVDLTLSNVKIIPIKVLGNDGYGYARQIANGMQYVLGLKQNSGYNIVAMNMSLGIPATSTDSEYSQIATQVNSAYNNGISCVVAAGNDGKNASGTCPANIANAITVSAVGVSGNTYSRPNWSNYGDVVDVAAPGNEIVSASNTGGTTSLSGTSMAAPHVSACVALLKSDPTRSYSPSEIDAALKSNVLDLGDVGKDVYFGYGMVDLEFAHTSLLNNVEFSRSGGACYEPFYLTLLHSNPEAQIYYTTDGSLPSSTNGTLYTHVIKIETSTRVRAIAYVIENGVIVSFSKVSEMTYHFSNIDILENYKVEDGVLTEYTGMLKHIIIPADIGGEQIVEIGANAFKNSDIESITFSDNVTKIGKRAFYNCSKLENVYAPNVEFVDDEAFYYCTNLKEIGLSNFKALRHIGKRTFYNCTSLEQITLPKLEFVDYQAFCMDDFAKTKLRSINFPQATIIAEEAFVYCKKLTEVILPNIQTLCSDAFYGCSIVSVSLPEVKYLGNYAFYMNESLTQVSIPKAEIISSYCFYGTNLGEIVANNAKFVGKYAFYNCTNLTKAEFGLLEEIGELAFAGCVTLEDFCAENVLTIQNQAFYNCESLKSISFPKIISIKDYAFYGCNLESVKLSESLSFVGNKSFYGTKITCKFYVYSNTPIKEYLESAKIPFVDLKNESTLYLYQELEDEVYIAGYTSVSGEIVVPSYINGKKVTKILDNAFSGCKNLTALNSIFVTEVGESAFFGCENLCYVNLESAKEIGTSAFEGCSNLQTLNIKNATKIGSNAFYNCPKLLMAEVSKNVTQIGEKAFAYLSPVDGVYQMVSTFVLYGYGEVAQNYVQNISLQKESGIVNSTISYEENYHILTQDEFSFTNLQNDSTASLGVVQNYLSGNIIIPSTVLQNSTVLTIVTIGEKAFDDCSFIENVVLPSSVTTILSEAFKNCSKLKTINLENIVTIDTSAFEGCDSLKIANIPKVVELAVNAFKDCPSLETVVAPELLIVYKEAFMNCYNLQNVDMPNVLAVRERGFYNCSSLKTIVLNKAVVLGTQTEGFFSSAVGEVFYGCSSLTRISLGAIQDICPNCFYGTNLKEVVIGNSVLTRYLSQTSSNFNRTTTIYGYSGTSAQFVANYSGANFVPLSAFSVSLLESVQFAQNSKAKICVTSNGMEETFEWFETTGTVQDGIKLVGETKNCLEINTSSVGEKKYFARVTNFNGEIKISNIISVFVEESFKVGLNIVGEGVVNPCADEYVLSGGSLNYLITPRIGYYVSKIQRNGIDVSQDVVDSIKDGGTFELDNINENTMLEVVFEIYKYNLSISYGEHGTALLDAGVTEWGTDRTISFTHDAGYGIEKLTINGLQVYLLDDVSVDLVYVLKDIRNDMEIFVTFANKFNVIAENLSEGGEITSSKVVNYDENCQITIIPNKGYRVSRIIVDGNELSQGQVEQVNNTKTYTFSGVKTEHKISVYYALNTFKITYEVGENGTIFFDKQVEEIEYGEDRTIYINPSKGYVLDELIINGQKVKVSGSTYVIKNISSNLDIKVGFKVNEGTNITNELIIILVIGGGILITIFVVIFTSLTRKTN